MLSLNLITLAGNLGADLEVKTLDGDRTVGKFRLAVNTSWKDSKGQRQQRTDWFTCVLWNPKQGALKYLTKGANVWLTGEVKTRQHEDQTYFDVVVRQWRLVSRKADEALDASPDDEAIVEDDDKAPWDDEPTPTTTQARGRKRK